MKKDDIVPGGEYALRERGAPGLDRVRVIEHIRRDKWRVEWVEPNPGLVDYAKSSAICCPWTDRKRLLRDERDEQTLREQVAREWPGMDHPLDKAVNEVLESTGEVAVSLVRGILEGPPDALDRVAERAHFEWPSSALTYVDRTAREQREEFLVAIGR